MTPPQSYAVYLIALFPGRRGLSFYVGNAQAERSRSVWVPRRSPCRGTEGQGPGHDVEGLKIAGRPGAEYRAWLTKQNCFERISILIKSYAGRRLYNTVELDLRLVRRFGRDDFGWR